FTLVFDEIQCGMGRTGTLLYAEQLGVAPDVVLLSKSLGGGLAKISACCIRRDHASDTLSLVHSSTFAEDDPSAAVARRTLSLVLASQDSPIRRARDRGAWLARRLRALWTEYPDVVREVRGAGLMLGLELRVEPAGAPGQGSGVPRALAEQGLLGYAIASYLLHRHRVRVMPCISAPSVLRLEPSVRLTRASVRRLGAALTEVCAILRAGDAHALMRHLVEGPQGAPAQDTPSVEVASRPAEPAITAAKRAGLIGYFVDAGQMPLLDRSLSRFTLPEREALIDRVWRELAPTRASSGLIRSITGDTVELVQYGLFLDSRAFAVGMRTKDRLLLRDLTERAAERARDEGCTVIAFGGLTSIVTGNCRDLFVPGACLTTGNSLTVSMSLDAARREAPAMGIALGEATLGVLGAGGNIGSVYALSMSDEVARVVLVCRPGHEATLQPLVRQLYARAFGRLRAGIEGAAGLAKSLLRNTVTHELLAGGALSDRAGLELARRPGPEALVTTTSDPSQLRGCSIVLCATSSPRPVLHPEHLASDGPVLVVDVAVPGDADPRVRSLAPRVNVVTGGTVDLGPLNTKYDPRAPLPKGHLYACGAEAAVLALEGRTDLGSVGAIRQDRVQELRALAARHGFGVAHGEHPGALAPLRRRAG
ncbi:MAG: aminotransferase class III-fold pyridoxal phosphate-dependent enzyme, partial [Sandaracinaceae bacterium]|nr:aminotransferase class III-fold pyridoxal phosphate-dependent enzyme [Sandaracinaceae bacterium]